MDKVGCAKAIAAVVPNGQALLEEHLREYGELLLHVFADVFTDYLKKTLQSGEDAKPCLQLLERMRFEGDSYVCNLLDVTILETLSDDKALWQALGRQVSADFRMVVNRDILPNNGMFAGVKPLGG